MNSTALRWCLVTLFPLLSAGVSFDPSGQASAQSPSGTVTATVIARDPVTGDIGIAVRSDLLAGGSIVPWAAAAAGGVASQGAPDPAFGPEGLRMLGYGWSASQVLDSLLAADQGRELRQMGIVDRMGTAAAYTGPGCAAYSGHRIGAGYAVLASAVTGPGTVDSIAAAFERTGGDLAARLLAGIAAGRGPGGRRSAALLVVREGGGYASSNDRFVDLRVDDAPDAVAELSRIYGVWSSTFLVENRLATIDRFNANRQFSAAQEETKRLVETLNAELRDHPDDPAVLDRVARVLSTAGISKDRALELSTRAVRLAPGNLRYLDTQAECHFRLGQVDEAIRIASGIVAKEPGNAYYRGRLQAFLDAKPK